MNAVTKAIRCLVIYTLVFLFSWMYVLVFLVQVWKHRNKPSSHKARKEAPSCLHDRSIGEHHTLKLKHSNLKIHYVENGPKDGPLMLFVHGFPDFWYGWRYQLKEFGKDYRAVAIDLPGYGDSDKPEEVTKYQALELAGNVKEFIEALGYTSCVLVGHDWGGLISFTVALEFPEMVDKLTIINAPHGKAFMKHVKTINQLFRSSYMFFFQLPYLPEYFLSAGNAACFDGLRNGKALTNLDNLTEDDVDAYKYTFLKGGFTAPLNYYRNVFSVSKQKQKRMQQVKMPAIIIWGIKDTALSVELAVESAKYLDEGVVKYVNGAAHFPHVDQPEVVHEYMREFLKSHS